MVVIYSVEGNIGSGKSTLVAYLKEHLSHIEYDITTNQKESLTILGQNGVQHNIGTYTFLRYFITVDDFSVFFVFFTNVGDFHFCEIFVLSLFGDVFLDFLG